jgi:phosphatidyl-myo-inositol dimannoside synthase
VIVPLKLGVLTRNFPPSTGGMSAHAFGIASSLAQHAELTVFAPDDASAVNGAFRLYPQLQRDALENRELLASVDVDAWFALSANFVVLAPYSRVPFFAYCHGNDFLHPNPNPRSTLHSRLARLPLLWRWSDASLSPFKDRIIRYRRRELQRSFADVTLTFVNSAHTRELLGGHYDVRKVPVVVAHPGCDDTFYQTHSASDSQTVTFLSVCNLVSTNRRKNVDGVLRALRLLPEGLAWRYVVIGGGDDLPRLKELAIELGIDDRTQFLGRVSGDELLQRYREADLFVLPVKATHIDVEGFGMVYIEANASGVPVLASAEGGALDAVIDGVTGYVAPRADPECIAGYLQRFLENPRTFDPLRIQEFAETFRWPRIAAEMIEEMRKYLPAAPPREQGTMNSEQPEQAPAP